MNVVESNSVLGKAIPPKIALRDLIVIGTEALIHCLAMTVPANARAVSKRASMRVNRY